jgi:hypothetical protein
MAERDKLIKSGQFTLPRLFFLAVVGGIITATVALGGIWLTIGYWLLTLSFCALLLVVAFDYGIKMDQIGAAPQTVQDEVATQSTSSEEAASAARVRRRTSRSPKRRR